MGKDKPRTMLESLMFNHACPAVSQCSHGLAIGWKDLVSQVEYIQHDPSKKDLEALHVLCHTEARATIHTLTNGDPRSLPLETLRTMYRESQQ